MNGSSIFKNGELIFFSLAFITYVPQLFFHIVSGETYENHYNIFVSSQFSAIYIFIFMGLVLLGNRTIPRLKLDILKYFTPLAELFYGKFAQFFISTAGLVLSIYFFSNFGVDFRQNERLTDGGALVLFVFLMQTYMQTWYIYLAYKIINLKTYSKFDRMVSITFSICLFLTLTGSLNMLFVMWSLLFSLSPINFIFKIFGVVERKNRGVKGVIYFVGLLFSILISLVLILSVGFVNKYGYEGSLERLNLLGFLIVEQIMVRLSSSYASVISFVNNHLTDYDMYDVVWSLTPENFLYRASKIFGIDGEYPRPEITQINRINYLNYILDNHLDHAGASPGIVATGFYIAPFPLGFFVAIIYSIVFIRLWGSLSSAVSEKLHVISLFFYMSMSFSMLESPLDYLLIIEPSLFYLIFVLLISTLVIKKI